MPLHHFHCTATVAFVEFVKCPLLHTRVLNRFESIAHSVFTCFSVWTHSAHLCRQNIKHLAQKHAIWNTTIFLSLLCKQAKVKPLAPAKGLTFLVWFFCSRQNQRRSPENKAQHSCTLQTCLCATTQTYIIKELLSPWESTLISVGRTDIFRCFCPLTTVRSKVTNGYGSIDNESQILTLIQFFKLSFPLYHSSPLIPADDTE